MIGELMMSIFGHFIQFSLVSSEKIKVKKKNIILRRYKKCLNSDRVWIGLAGLRRTAHRARIPQLYDYDAMILPPWTL